MHQALLAHQIDAAAAPAEREKCLLPAILQPDVAGLHRGSPPASPTIRRTAPANTGIRVRPAMPGKSSVSGVSTSRCATGGGPDSAG